MIGTTGHRGSQKQEALESPEVGIRQIFTLCWAQNQELYNSNTYNILDNIRQVAQLCSVQNPAKVSCIGMSWAGMGLDGVGYEHLLRKRTFAGISLFEILSPTLSYHKLVPKWKCARMSLAGTG